MSRVAQILGKAIDPPAGPGSSAPKQGVQKLYMLISIDRGVQARVLEAIASCPAGVVCVSPIEACAWKRQVFESQCLERTGTFQSSPIASGAAVVNSHPSREKKPPQRRSLLPEQVTFWKTAFLSGYALLINMYKVQMWIKRSISRRASGRSRHVHFRLHGFQGSPPSSIEVHGIRDRSSHAV